MQLPEAVTSAHEPDAVALLRRYYQEVEPGFSGRHFDGWDPAGRRSEDKNRFTSDDLVAVTFLSLAVPPRAAYRVLVTQRDELNALLAQVPDVDLADVPEGVIDEQWPAWRLWDLLRAGHDGIGWVTAGKLLATSGPGLSRSTTTSSSRLWAHQQASGKRSTRNCAATIRSCSTTCSTYASRPGSGNT